MYRLSRCVPLAHEDKTFQDAHQHADITNPKKPIMKFMITWQFHQGKLHEGYSQFFKMTLSLLTKVSRAKNPFVETFSHYAMARMHPPRQLGRRKTGSDGETRCPGCCGVKTRCVN
jgi:hypothetical protein